ncbi:MAG: 50S ribosomal protein L10 [Candidatus Woesearchaeota archaeon]
MNMHKIPQYKQKVVSEIVDNIGKYPIVGVVNMSNLPAPQLQRMRENLRGKVIIFMTKKRLFKIALDKAKGFEVLKDHLLGMPAMIFTKENPFALFKVLKENKSKAPAKAGQLAPHDIIVTAGPTSFAPGPVIGELGALGIKTQVEAGKITIREDAVVCREGKPISDKLAAMLVRLGIEPMEVGLDLVVTLEHGVLFTKKVLDVDEKQFVSNIALAHACAMSLALEISYASPGTIKQLLSKAHLHARAIAKEGKILTKDTVSEMVEQAVIEARLVKSTANIDADESLPDKAKIVKQKETNEVEDLAKELVRKGTLRR